MLDKTYRPSEVEPKHYEQWENSGAFAARTESNQSPYTIMMPPPNVTGSLHMGHALTFTLQDVLIRYHRMAGRDALWQPGTDHAGIATQMVVERQLEAKGITRHDLGRDKFIERVWEWKAESGGTITRQLRRLGASPDWAKERFTMDEGLSAAVRKVFVTLYKQGLIYRDKRLVNWDPKLHTAISDLEVEQREVKGHMWHFKYPVEGMADTYITVATTRPETMLGDSAVAVHPEDERYTHLVGKMVRLPIVGRLIPIVADEYSDPTKGTGAVKITPAHDFNDFEVGKRHDLPQINILDRDAKLNDAVPEEYRGMDRYDARKKVVAAMEELGLLDKIEPNPHTVPYGDRSGVVIEPWLTDQWYVDAATLAKPALEAVETGKTKFHPKHWENTYYEWMRNIQPWCVSRQIWWGHQVPAWYGPDGHVFVEEVEAEANAAAAAHYGHSVELVRDTDVLDTWFSSALWPFSTLGWPEQTPELARYYPTDVLVTGFDIIFFWVARMMMMGIHFMGDVPFKDIYIHALVRDEKGQKMSKSKGNVIDPLDLMDKYGCDAVRFTLAALAAQGRDIKLAEGRVEGYRNFATKLWNAARFCQMNECAPVDGFDPRGVTEIVNRWVIGKVAETADKVAQALSGYRYDAAAGAAYQFVWGTFCDWYLEFAKPIFSGSDEAAKAETRATAAWVFDTILHILHPFMPFITEELWAQMGDGRDVKLMLRPWPVLPGLHDAAAEEEMDWVVRMISTIRGVRSEMNVPPSTQVDLLATGLTATKKQWAKTHAELINRLARLAVLETAADPQRVAQAFSHGAAQMVVDEATLVLPLAGVIDVDKERQRLEKEVTRVDGEIAKVDKKFANPDFVARAAPEVVEENRERREEWAAAKAKLQEALQRLSGA
ncbi:Valyl-tRNA synthetase (Valine--tRNA ligase) [Magnetospirillum gryphiswaldense MSR-1 v2]|uniref:Valine--tRNA ligase n=1 Tax=Magnetospirillum gryphiswaldense (strain DSM 6361 / JCM 21280 / NBRC 15271 / MSR-1) TaxID=431944 RepID=V6F1Z6_MAGGM|nr:valine--tRNA ligase [Magnetospirillum gryphiswaldense]CDK98291.1 Valyl-tRNA synthetase (Valine--tRNA ligase) [Magnetospirillum gryphiswaldense MSR-1 v2]